MGECFITWLWWVCFFLLSNDRPLSFTDILQFTFCYYCFLNPDFQNVIILIKGTCKLHCFTCAAFNDGLSCVDQDDLLSLKVGSVLHHLSIKRAIQVLRLNNYGPNCLRRRPSDEVSAATLFFALLSSAVLFHCRVLTALCKHADSGSLCCFRTTSVQQRSLSGPITGWWSGYVL